MARTRRNNRRPKKQAERKRESAVKDPVFTVASAAFLRGLSTVSDCLKAGRVLPPKQVIAITATKKGTLVIEGGPASIDAISGDTAYARFNLTEGIEVTTPGTFVTTYSLLRLKYPGSTIEFKYDDRQAEISYKSGNKTGIMVTSSSLEKVRRSLPKQRPDSFTSANTGDLREALAAVLFKASSVEDDLPDVLVTLSLEATNKVPKKSIERNADKPPTHLLTAIVFDRQRSATVKLYCTADKSTHEFTDAVFSAKQLSTFLRRSTDVRTIKFGVTHDTLWLRSPDLMTVTPRVEPTLTAANVIDTLNQMAKTPGMASFVATRDNLVKMAESARSVRESAGSKNDDDSTYNRVSLTVSGLELLIRANTVGGSHSIDRVQIDRVKNKEKNPAVDINVLFLIEAAKKHQSGLLQISFWANAIRLKGTADNGCMRLQHWIGTLTQDNA